jgi:WD40 repeat protein
MADASRFVTTFQDPILYSAPHIYLAALPFLPVESKVSQHFRYWFLNMIVINAGRASHWPTCVLRLDDHRSSVTSVTFSPDGKLIVAGSYNWAIMVWDAEMGDIISGPLDGHTGSVTSVAFLPDCKQIISGSLDQTMRVWDMQTGISMIGPLVGHTNGILCIACSPDGRYIASGSTDKTVQLWDTKTGIFISELEGHKTDIISVTFSGQKIISASKDWTVRIWDVDVGHSVLAHFKGHNNNDISSVAVLPHGKRIICADWRPTHQVWDVDTGNPVSAS